MSYSQNKLLLAMFMIFLSFDALANRACQLVTVIHQQSVRDKVFSQKGVGWVIGHAQNSQKRYILVPAHVVAGIHDPTIGWLQSISVQCGQIHRSVRIRAQSATLDLALLEVDDHRSLSPLLTFDSRQLLQDDLPLSGQNFQLLSTNRFNETHPETYQIQNVIFDLMHDQPSAVFGAFIPIVLPFNAVRPGFSGSALLYQQRPVGMITRTEINGNRAFGLSIHDVWVALRHLIEGRDPWAAYSEQDRFYMAAVSRLAPWDPARVSHRRLRGARAAIEFQFRFDETANMLYRKRRLVIQDRRVRKYYDDICEIGIAKDASDFYSVGRTGEVGDSGQGLRAFFRSTSDGELVFTGASGQNSSFYRFTPKQSCKDGVMTENGRIFTAFEHPERNVFHRISGLEDLFRFATFHLFDLDQYLVQAGIFNSSNAIIPMCRSRVLGQNLTMAITSLDQNTSSILYQNREQLVSRESHFLSPYAVHNPPRNFIACTPDRQHLAVAFNDEKTDGFKLSMMLARAGITSGHRPGSFGEIRQGSCRIEFAAEDIRVINDWTFEIQKPEIHLRIMFHTQGDLMKIQVYRLAAHCLPRGSWQDLFLMTYIFQGTGGGGIVY